MCVCRYSVSESVSAYDQFTVISLIHISDVQTEDLSAYNCTATNDHGVVSVIITLLQKGRPTSLRLSFSLSVKYSSIV